MCNMMNKVTHFLRNLSNASSIRTAYNRRHTVRRRLEGVNSGIAGCLLIFIVALVAMKFEQTSGECMVAAVTSTLIGIWLYGYRRAVAFGQTDRQNYLARSRRAFRRICRALGKLALVAILLAVLAVILAILVEKFGFLVDVLPPLQGISDSIVAQLNEMLGIFLA